MKIVVEIPIEFEDHFKNDRFKDSLMRLIADANCVAGNYERETADMLIHSFENSQIVEGCDDAVSREKVLDILYLDPGITEEQEMLLKQLPTVESKMR